MNNDVSKESRGEHGRWTAGPGGEYKFEGFTPKVETKLDYWYHPDKGFYALAAYNLHSEVIGDIAKGETFNSAFDKGWTRIKQHSDEIFVQTETLTDEQLKDVLSYFAPVRKSAVVTVRPAGNDRILDVQGLIREREYEGDIANFEHTSPVRKAASHDVSGERRAAHGRWAKEFLQLQGKGQYWFHPDHGFEPVESTHGAEISRIKEQYNLDVEPFDLRSMFEAGWIRVQNWDGAYVELYNTPNSNSVLKEMLTHFPQNQEIGIEALPDLEYTGKVEDFEHLGRIAASHDVSKEARGEKGRWTNGIESQGFSPNQKGEVFWYHPTKGFYEIPWRISHDEATRMLHFGTNREEAFDLGMVRLLNMSVEPGARDRLSLQIGDDDNTDNRIKEVVSYFPAVKTLTIDVVKDGQIKKSYDGDVASFEHTSPVRKGFDFRDELRAADGRWMIGAGIEKRLVQRALMTGGYTYQPVTRGSPRPYKDDWYSVSTHQDREQIITVKSLSPTKIHSFIKKNLDLITKGSSIGAWVDTESGSMYLDVVELVKDKEEAKRLMEVHKQKAIWSFLAMQEIRNEKALSHIIARGPNRGGYSFSLHRDYWTPSDRYRETGFTLGVEKEARAKLGPSDQFERKSSLADFLLGHDVSGEARGEDGRWTKIGKVFGKTPQERSTFIGPEPHDLENSAYWYHPAKGFFENGPYAQHMLTIGPLLKDNSATIPSGLNAGWTRINVIGEDELLLATRAEDADIQNIVSKFPFIKYLVVDKMDERGEKIGDYAGLAENFERIRKNTKVSTW